jgi:superfamily I DNA and/or RNA helicase
MKDSISELASVSMALVSEREEDHTFHEAWLKRKSIQERKEAGLTWFTIKINESGYGIGAYPFLVIENPGKRYKHHFQSSSPVQLFSAAPGNEEETINGTIGYVDDSQMKIAFRVDELPDWVDDGKIGVNLLFDSRTYDEMFRALNELINVEKGRLKELREIILGYQKGSRLKLPPLEAPRLNTSQIAAMQMIVETEDFAIVHGPPGTGKTTTLVESIIHLHQREGQILVCAPSNAATDHLTRSLAARGMQVVRIGNLARIEEDASAHTLDVLLQQDRDYKQVKDLKRRAIEMRKIGAKYKRSFGKEEAEQRKLLMKEAKDINREARELESYIVEKILDHAHAITCTLIGASNELLSNRNFHTVVIDEAGQAIEPATWVPILKAKKVILAGDPWQLPPTVKSRKAENEGLAVSLLEKAITRTDMVSLLHVQYRMHEKIMGFSNQQFYAGQLIAHEDVRHHHIPSSPEVVEFIDTAGCGFEEQAGDEGESLCNPEEAALLFRHFGAIRESLSGGNTVAIISPYRAQVSLLESIFAEMPEVVVNTIDSFQGQERDIVYISLVRSNEKNEIGFLKDYRRMNVAITRARKKVVIIGDSATLGHDGFFKDLLEYSESIGAYRSAWEFISS